MDVMNHGMRETNGFAEPDQPYPTEKAYLGESEARVADDSYAKSTMAMPSLFVMSNLLSSLERNIQHMTIGAIQRNESVMHPLQDQLQTVRQIRDTLADARLQLEAESDRLITEFDEVQVTIGKLTSELYSFKNKLRT